jgi:hypothetical protein
MKRVFSTNMRFLIINDACITSITVDIFSVISDATQPTFCAVIIIALNSIIEKITYFTEITGKFYFAGHTFITDRLLGITFGADDFFDVEPIYFMHLILVMTKSTSIYFITTW